MSTIKVNKIENTATADGGIAIDASGHVQIDGVQLPNAGALSNRSLIINGAMVFDQRNSGSSVTPTGNTYVLDRWQAVADASSKYSVQQVSDAPTGFSFSQKITSLSAYTPTSGQLFALWQYIEGFNSAQLEFGTSSAKTITVSFYVKSSLTGTFGGGILNSGYTRGYPFEYTISSANTWEYKTVTIPGDTSGTWIGATNGQGLLLSLTLGAGSARSNTAGAWSGTQYSFSPTGAVNVVSTNAATWQITGVQLEVGEKATAYSHSSYGDELARCQRYYEIARCVGWSRSSDNVVMGSISYKTEKRATPTSLSQAKVTGGGSGTVTTFNSSVYSVGVYQTGAAASSDCTYQVRADAEL